MQAETIRSKHCCNEARFAKRAIRQKTERPPCAGRVKNQGSGFPEPLLLGSNEPRAEGGSTDEVNRAWLRIKVTLGPTNQAAKFCWAAGHQPHISGVLFFGGSLPCSKGE